MKRVSKQPTTEPSTLPVHPLELVQAALLVAFVAYIVRRRPSALKLLNPLDPTFLFLFNTFWSVLFIEPNETDRSLSVVVPSLSAVFSTVVDPACLIGLAELCAFFYFTGDKWKKLNQRESLTMHWHLWNGILIYTMMDGLNGAFSEHGFLPILHEKGYRLVDRRYRRHLIGAPGGIGPSSYEVLVARTVNSIELFVYSWMSIMAAVGVATRARWHQTVETIVLTMAAYGTIVFVLPDMLDGCYNMQPMGVKECLPPLNAFYFFYVYFGVVINFIWLFVPLLMLWFKARSDFK